MRERMLATLPSLMVQVSSILLCRYQSAAKYSPILFRGAPEKNVPRCVICHSGEKKKMEAKHRKNKCAALELVNRLCCCYLYLRSFMCKLWGIVVMVETFPGKNCTWGFFFMHNN